MLCIASNSARSMADQPPMAIPEPSRRPGFESPIAHPKGSQWRIQYVLLWPSLKCHSFKVTSAEGGGSGEALGKFPCEPGDHILADRGYCHVDESSKAWYYGKLFVALFAGRISGG